MGMIDPFQRKINYLRLSITDHCNLSCRYCRSGQPKRHPGVRLLSDDELVFLARQAIGLGVEKLRITGGEPLVRPGVIPLLERLRALDGLKHLVLTSNGLLLSRYASSLAALGLERVNVSIDSLKPDRFFDITRGGSLTQWRRGIDRAETAGLKLKLNVVVMKGINDDEVVDFAQLSAQRGWVVRFIEYMPFGGAGRFEPVAEEVLQRRLQDGGYDLKLLPAAGIAGPAREYALVGTQGKVGFISAQSCPFCRQCNRLRITAYGEAKGCLFSPEGIDLRPVLEARDGQTLSRYLRQLIAEKPPRYESMAPGESLLMSAIGG